MDGIKLHGLESLFDTRLTSEIKPELSRTTVIFEDIANIVDELNHSLSRLNTTLHFSVDIEYDHTFYVVMVDTKTHETIRRFPIKEMPNFITIANS